MIVLVHHVAEQIHPANDAAVRVDHLEIEQTVVERGVGHEREHRNLAAVAAHERAELDILAHMLVAVRAGEHHARMVFGGEQMLGTGHEVGEPTDVLLELGVGVVDHHRIEANAGDD